MAYKFYNDHVYDGGLTGTDLINILQDKYGFLNQFDHFVNLEVMKGMMSQFTYIDEWGDEQYDLDSFLTDCFQRYILTQSSGVNFKKQGFPLIQSGNLVLNTIVRYE